MDQVLENNFYSKKKVLITGHTGFKGSWLALVLKQFGSEVYGLSDYSINSGLYEEIKNKQIFSDEEKVDINNSELINHYFKKYEFDLVFHFAAQGIVSKAKKYPLNTLKTNILGTFNILEAVNNCESIDSIVIATTDKVYADHDSKNTEDFKLGGSEFYSASKASAEHVINAFIKSYKRKDLNVSVVRSGNVLGGGDYGADRITTDVVNSIKSNKKIVLRNPNSIRPWQYVLDSIYGYLLVCKYSSKNNLNEIFNLNSSEANKYTVLELTKALTEYWGTYENQLTKEESTQSFYESKILTIDSSKAKQILGWSPIYNFEDMCKSIVEYEKSEDKFEWSLGHVMHYFDQNLAL